MCLNHLIELLIILFQFLVLLRHFLTGRCVSFFLFSDGRIGNLRAILGVVLAGLALAAAAGGDSGN